MIPSIYSQSEYCDKFKMSLNTLRRKVKLGLLPSLHSVKYLDGRGFVIVTSQCTMCETIGKAVREYLKTVNGKDMHEHAAYISIKYKINTANFFMIVGL